MKNNNLKRMATSVAIALIALLSLSAAYSGEEVMQAVYTRDSGNNMSATLVMTLTNSRGSTRERSIQQFRQNDAGGEKKIMFFLAPSDVKDTSFLSYSYSDGRSDDQWIYLPALKRTKRVAGDKKNESFMGSDFTYDDMGTRHPSADTHKVLRTEMIDGRKCLVVESIPKEAKPTYAKTLAWVVEDEWIGLKKEFYLPNGKVGKKLEISSYEKTDGVWVITDMTMSNMDKGSSTRIQMLDVSFNNDLKESVFTERQMKIGPRI
ncbi:MAG: outer membrane lipoprotein-sorting protein [Sphaerochaeta sp.]|nr:outer membrane lipoprotein-sorting protein [Sphaerochaeta sp.]